MSFLQRLLVLIAGALAALCGLVLSLNAGWSGPGTAAVVLVGSAAVGLLVALSQAAHPLRWIAGVLALFLALPTIKNLALYARYHHGDDVLYRTSGPPGLLGDWKGTVDAFPCGFDTRYELRLTLGADSSGFLTMTVLHDRIGGVYPSLYGWSALLPFDRSKAWVDVRAVRLLDGRHLEISARSGDPYPTTDLMALDADGKDRLRFGYVAAVGNAREGSGFDPSWPADLRDLLWNAWRRW